MSEQLTCTLVTPEKEVFSSEVEMVVVPGAEGDFGVMADHVPFVSIIRPGVVSLHNGGKVEKIFISAGYAETHGTECTILAESAEAIADMEKEKVEAQLMAARKQLSFSYMNQYKCLVFSTSYRANSSSVRRAT